MPVILVDNYPFATKRAKSAIRASGVMEFASEADPDATVTGASASGLITFTSLARPTRLGPASGEISFISSANGSVDGSPDTFGSAAGEIEFESSANPSKLVRASARGLIEFESLANGYNSQPDVHYLTFVFDTPATAGQGGEFGNVGSFVLDQPRILVGPVGTDPSEWEELPIGDWTYNEPENSASSTVSFRLARPEDLSFFEDEDIRIDFGVGRKEAEIWEEDTFTTLIRAGEFRGAESSVAWEGEAPTDAVTVTISSGLDEKLLTTAQTDLIIYDPARETVDVDLIEPLVDSDGVEYPPEVIAEAGLTLRALFDELLVSRCGFDGVTVNIPDYPIRRYNCSMGESLFDGLRGMVGMFDPVIYAELDTLWIVDTSITAPVGFPDPREYTPTKFKSLGHSTNKEKIDGFVVQYVEDEAAYDFFTYRTEAPEIATTGKLTLTTVRRFIQFRKASLPNIVQREALDRETRTTTISPGYPGADTIIDVEVEDNTYQMGLLKTCLKTSDSLLPDNNLSNDEETIYAMQRVLTETETYTYRTHPFRPQQKYLREKIMARSELVVTDTENRQFSEDFASPYKTAWRSGNVYQGMPLSTVATYSRREIAKPLRTGEVRVNVVEIDELKELVVLSYTENRAGDVGLGTSPSQNRRIVWAEENHARNTEKMVTVHYGEVPIIIGEPLARRQLIRRQTKGDRAAIEGIGFDRARKRGSTSTIKGRVPVGDVAPTLGKFVLVSRTLVGRGTVILASYIGKEI